MIKIDSNIISQSVETGITKLVDNPVSLIVGVVLIILTILFLIFFKNFLVNSIVGIIGFIFCALIGIKLPFWLTIISSGIFGLGGLGVVLILKFFGIV